MRLDFEYTCPVINQGIDNVKEVLYFEIKSLLEEINGKKLIKEDLENISKDFKDTLYSEIEYIFEDVRKVNEEMRTAANSQLDDMEGKNEDLKSEIEDLERSIKDLEKMPV